MFSTFTADSASKSQNLDSRSVLRLHKQNIMFKLMKLKMNDRKVTQKQTAKQTVISTTTIRRYRTYITINSLDNRRKPKRTLKDPFQPQIKKVGSLINMILVMILI